MNIYGVIAFIVTIIIFADVFNAVEPISAFIRNITNIPELGDFGQNSGLYKLGIRLAYLIVVVSVIKMVFTKSGNKEE